MTSKQQETYIENVITNDDDIELSKAALNDNLDEAQKIIGSGDLNDLDVSPEEMKKVIWKTDLAILPFLSVCYMFFYIDKTTLSYAAIFGLKDDLNLKGTQYSWLSSIFYFGYLAWAFPTNYMLLRFPVGKYLGINIFLWGVFLMLQAACNSFATLSVMRALGGAAEACADPAFMLITSMWYTRKEQPVRIGLWYTANGLGIAFGGLLGYGIGHINGKYSSWRYEFLIIGALCASWGIVVFLFVPDSPITAKNFTEREKQIIIYRLKDNQTGIETKVFKWKQVKETFMDPKTYAFFLITMFANIPNGGLSNFGTLIIQGFGFSTFVTTLMQIPNGFIISISILIAVFLNNLQTNRRIMMIILFMLPNISGAFGLYFLPEENKVGRLICYYLTGPYNAAFVLLLSLCTANTAGHTKKVFTNAMLFMGYCVGNISGPFFYKTAQAPKYPLGMGSLMFSHLAEVLLVILLGIYLYRLNKKRDRDYPIVIEDITETAFLDLTDKENHNFRYIY